MNLREMPYVRILGEWVARERSIPLAQALARLDSMPYADLEHLWVRMSRESK